jgi:site-specific DNA-methyltransferase (adenine-specific)
MESLPVVKPAPKTQLHLGNCLAFLRTLDSGSVDAVVTDPPYGMTDLHWDCVVPMSALWPEFERLTGPKSAIIVTASQPFTSAMVLSRPEWFRTEWIWRKNAGSNFATVKWHPMKEHESVLVFGRGPTTYNPIKQPRARPIKAGYTNTSNTGKRQAYSGVTHNKGFTVTDGDMRVPSSVQEWNRERGLHPNQKPLALCEYFVRTYADEGMTVLDPFMGSGTTGVACVNTGRNFIGCEIDPGYFAIAEKRIGEAKEKARDAMPNGAKGAGR